MVFGYLVWITLAAVPGDSYDAEVPMPEPHIYGGMPTTSCQWPTAAMLGFGGCSATLVSPWIVITAAHCVGDVENPGSIALGESLNAVQRELPVDYCHRGPDWNPAINNGVGGSDISYCKLVTPVYDYPVTPIVYGCETEILAPGREVWLVGVGANADDKSGFGIKRMGPSEIQFVDDVITENGIGIGTPMHSSCGGDSGGPAYVQYPDGSWHVFGVVSGGPQGCGTWPSNYTAMHAWVPWIEEDSGIDVTPCHDVDGTWNPTGFCQGFEMDPFEGGDWAEMCIGEVSPASATCGAAFDSVPDADPPVVTITAPADETIYDAAPAKVMLTLTVDDGAGWGVRFVRVSIDGDVQDVELREPPYELSADFPKGGFEIVGIAEDWAGNVGESEVLRIAVDDELPPLPAGTSTGAVDETGAEQETGAPDETDAATPDESSGEASGGPPADGDGDEGCGCATSPPRSWHALLVGLAATAFRRRRRS